MLSLSAKKPGLFALTLALALSQAGCLKTRAQLREEVSDEDRPAAPVKAAPVQDVQPQGQYVLDEIKSEMTRLQGRVEDLERTQAASSSAKTTSSDEIKKLEQRIQELEQAQASMIEAIKKLQEAPIAADPAELIEKGKTQMGAGNYAGAIDTFTAALKGATGKKAEEATFLRGEAHYAQKEFKKAIVDYSKFPEKFTRSQYMPKALFQIGRSFEALGMKDDAKGFYQELVENFPKSPEAKKAKSKVR